MNKLLLPQLKHVCKCCTILITAIVVDVFLGHIMIVTMSMLTSQLTALGKFGTLLMIFMNSIVVELCVVCFIIGLLGGKWIGGRPINGFILSGVYYVCWFVPPTTSEHPPEFDFLTFLIFLGLPLVVIMGGLIYTKVCKSVSSYNE